MKWEDPGLKTSAKTNWSIVFAELRTRPGEWALVAEDVSPATVQRIKHGALGGAEAGEFEATARRVKDKRGAIYARYVGEPHER